MGLFRKANRRLGTDVTNNNNNNNNTTTTPSTVTHALAPGQDASDPTVPEKQPARPATAVSDGKADADDGDRLAASVSKASSHHEYPTGLRLAFLLVSIFSSMFLVAIDRLIISTAIPRITDEFHSLPDVGWYGSGYLLTQCSFQLMFGKLYSFFPIKGIFLFSVVLFEVGSAICGAAPSSAVFILGRAVAGVGGAGILSGVIIIIVHAVPLAKRPLYQGLFGAVFGLASVVGPLLGGAFTSGVSWRWCFYINLPIGGVAFVLVALLLKVPDTKDVRLPLRAKLAQLDALGTTCLIPGVVCLLLALQWGGLEYAWNSPRIIVLLVLGIVLMIGFALVQVYMPKTATIAPRIFKQRSILAGCWATICVGSQMMIFVYFLPIWFQAIKGSSPVDSGIHLIPMVLTMVAASILNGIFVSKIGYYTPSMMAGTCLMCIGAGLLTTLQVDTAQARWVGYQVLYGFGLGMTFQTPNLAAQTVLPTKDVPIGTTLMFFSQVLGGAIFISVGQNVLNNELVRRLTDLPGFDTRLITQGGATSLSGSLADDLRGPVLMRYNEALRTVFHVGLILACLVSIGSAAMEFRSVKKKAPQKATDAEAGAAGKPAEKADEASVGARSDAGVEADQKQEAAKA